MDLVLSLFILYFSIEVLGDCIDYKCLCTYSHVVNFLILAVTQYPPYMISANHWFVVSLSSRLETTLNS